MFTFYLMTEKGYRVLEALVTQGHAGVIDAVVGARDKNISHDFYEEIKALCAANSISFHDRNEGKPGASVYTFAIAWRWLIQAENLIVLHDSLLPRYRGFAPLVAALINGDAQVGVTALFAEETFDTGDIIGQVATTLTYPVKISEAIRLVSELYVQLLLQVVQQVRSGQALSGTKQDETKASYSLWRDEEDYRIDWSKPAAEIRRFVDAVGEPYKGASSLINGTLVRITEAEEKNDLQIENRTPGKVLFMEQGLPVVVCGHGLLKIHNMQCEDGTPALPLKQFRTRFK